MPRRNHKPRRRPAYLEPEPKQVTTDAMAHDLVRRGLASPMILGRHRQLDDRAVFFDRGRDE